MATFSTGMLLQNSFPKKFFYILNNCSRKTCMSPTSSSSKFDTFFNGHMTRLASQSEIDSIRMLVCSETGIMARMN